MFTRLFAIRPRERTLAGELLERLIRDAAKAQSRVEIVQEKKFSERLEEAQRKHHNRAIETAQVIEELIAMAKAFQETLERDQRLGLSTEEVAFYGALAEDEGAVRELGDETLKKNAVEITKKTRNRASVDWQKRESVRARLRILFRRTLKRWMCAPSKTEAAINLVMEQAEEIADGLSQM